MDVLGCTGGKSCTGPGADMRSNILEFRDEGQWAYATASEPERMLPHTHVVVFIMTRTDSVVSCTHSASCDQCTQPSLLAAHCAVMCTGSHAVSVCAFLSVRPSQPFATTLGEGRALCAHACLLPCAQVLDLMLPSNGDGLWSRFLIFITDPSFEPLSE